MLDRLANEIIEHAKVGGMTLATAESCSAGRLAQSLAKAGSGLNSTLTQGWRPVGHPFPSLNFNRMFVEIGGLISYGSNLMDGYAKQSLLTC
jgi:hypothetical protein